MDQSCWCGAPKEHETPDERAWCKNHAPRCRSGAHFYGNCQCTGCGCPRPGRQHGCECLAKQGFRWTSDDWCSCRCHRVAIPFNRESQDIVEVNRIMSKGLAGKADE